jgi:hypothetical protein
MKIRGRRFFLVLALALCLPITAAMAGGDVNVIFGKKMIDDSDLEDLDVDDQDQFGIAVSLGFGNWPVELAIDLLSSSDDNTAVYADPAYSYNLQYNVDVDTTELSFGVRKYWGKRGRPYVGGGLGFTQLDGSVTAVRTFGQTTFTDRILDDDDSDLSFWVNGGYVWLFGRSFNLGVDVRYSDSDAKLSISESSSSVKFDSGGTHVGVMLGYHW